MSESITTASAWKKPVGEELKLPSGNVCLIKRPGIEKLFAAGVLPDEMTKIALESIESAQAPGKPQDHLPKGGVAQEALSPEAMKKFMESPNAIRDIFASFDRITEMCVLQPKVAYHMKQKLDLNGSPELDEHMKPVWENIPSHERNNEEFLYTDDIDQEDKAYIFNFVVGGTRDIETFREELGDDVATVQPREDVELPPI